MEFTRASRHIAGLLFLLAVFSSSAHAKLKDWAAYQSENFVIYTDEKEKTAIKLLKEFETFRKVVLGVTGIGEQAENHRLMILMYSRGNEFRQLGQKNAAGFYIYTSAGPRMVIGPAYGMDAKTILFHEYVHYLVRQHTDLNLPRWYDEGFAELLSATEFKHGAATIGAIPVHRAKDLVNWGRLSVNELIQPIPRSDSRLYNARFYASAWLFTHYLQISPAENKLPLHEQTNDYNRRFNNGEDPIMAFDTSFGLSPDAMDSALRAYQNKRRLTVLTLKVDDYSGDVSKRELPAAERAFVLADMAWRVGEEELALEYLREVKQGEEAFAAGLSLQAVLENHNDNVDLAYRLGQSALALDESNTQVQANLAHLDADSFDRSLKQNTPDYTLLDRSLVHAHKATEIDEDNLEAYRFQWQGHQLKKDAIKAATSMMAAYRLEPGSITINQEIGRLLMKEGKPTLARPFWQRVYNWTHSDEEQEKIRAILDEIDLRSAEQATVESAASN